MTRSGETFSIWRGFFEFMDLFCASYIDAHLRFVIHPIKECHLLSSSVSSGFPLASLLCYTTLCHPSDIPYHTVPYHTIPRFARP